MNKKSNLVFGIGITTLFIFIMWFFILYGSVNLGESKILDISEPIQNKTQDIFVDYNYEIKVPSVSFHKAKDQTIHATIDVGGIITAVIGASVSMILSKLLNRYWPDKKSIK